MPPACTTPAPNPWTAGPANGKDADQQDVAAGPRIVRLAAPLVVLAALALLLIAIANLQVARRREAVEQDLAIARSAAALVPQHLATADSLAVSADLHRLSRASTDARRDSAGPLWALASRVNPDGSQLAAIRRDVLHSSALASAADPLSRSLRPLTQDGAGPDELDRLDDLARGLSDYTSAAARIGDPSGPALERASMAAGLLPDLAGAQASRTWTICRTTSGPCLSATVTSGRLGPIASTPAGPIQTHDRDLLIIGLSPASLFDPAGSAVHLPAMFALLDNLGSAPIAGRPQVTIQSVVQLEQYTLDQLATSRS